jgi:hypothetical protein
MGGLYFSLMWDSGDIDENQCLRARLNPRLRDQRQQHSALVF